MWTVPADRPEHEDAIARVVSEIEASADRPAAIVAASLLEYQIEQSIKRRLLADERIQSEMFRSTGPLGTFSAKIKLAYLMRILSERSTREIETVRTIRNAFAHDITIVDFDSQRIRDLTNNLDHICNFTVTITDVETGTKTLRYFETPPNTPRERYLRTCQIAMSILSLAPVEVPAQDVVL